MQCILLSYHHHPVIRWLTVALRLSCQQKEVRELVKVQHFSGGWGDSLLPSKEPITYIPYPKSRHFWVDAFPKESRERWDMEERFPGWRVSGTAGDPKVGISCWWNSNLGRECQFFGDMKDAGRLSQWGCLRPYFVCWCCYSYFCVGSPGVS